MPNTPQASCQLAWLNNSITFLAETLHHHSAQSFQVSGAQLVLRLLQKTLRVKCHILPHHVFQQKLYLHVLNVSISSWFRVHSCPEIQAKRVCPHTRQYLLWQFNEEVVGVMIMSYFTAFRMATTVYSKGCCFIHLMHDYTGTKKTLGLGIYNQILHNPQIWGI